MSMKRIRLELARDHEFPEGSRERGYEFAAPLDERGHLVADEWRTMRDRCRVKRFWAGAKGRDRTSGAPPWRRLGLR